MFTGLIETVGTLSRIETRGNYRVLTVASSIPSEELTMGESIACDGACLTVTAIGREEFTVEASQETAARTIVGSYANGDRINLERALKLGSRLGGHMVAGHVDTQGSVDYLRPVGESLELAIRFDQQYDPLVIDKGSIAIDGVSLTINETRPGWCSVNLIPHTAQSTTLKESVSGRTINLEFDMVGKYILKATGYSKNKGLTIDKLLESGW
ncbi:riboflavin synthase [candidate division GN15 bacterium]|nr:riboflavin synthase [candidate division GN15 bacterium]